MKIEHLAIWVNKLEDTRLFYETYFNATSSDRYHNPVKQFTSYFLSFETGCRLELMHQTAMPDNGNQQAIGLAHFAVSVGHKESVDALTNKLRRAGYNVVGEPRTTGDGYYESVVLDPEGNHIEITI